ncbi:MAG: antA/AntB antirepressor family protein [Burkholderiales bacterium]|nr:antA/AntB antirepressor family protein [Burkholderiales bacterium]
MADALIPVFSGAISGTTVQLCDARTLHTFMQVKRDFTTWIKARIRKFGFVENEDYLLTKSGEQLPSGTKYVHDYHLTLDMAKELSMVENNEQGRAARKYFIACERQAMAAGSVSLTPYTVQPSDTLTEPQQIALRALLESNVKRLPHDKQAGAMVKGWSKLKAHFGVPYRQIPASEFTEAISIVARHVAEWELVEDAPKAGTVQAIVADWVKKIEEPNGYPAMLFEPIVEVVQRKMGNQPAQPDAARTKAAFDAASQAAASVQSAVFNAVLSGNDEWKYSRWMLAFIDDSAKGSPAYVRQLEHGAFTTTWPRLVRDVGTGECMCTSAELLDMAYACMQRLAHRGAAAKLAA